MTETNDTNEITIAEASLFPKMRSNQFDVAVRTIFEDFKNFSLEDDDTKNMIPSMIDKYLLTFKDNKLNLNKQKERKFKNYKILNKFDGPIRLVLKQIHPDTSIAKTCIDLINIYINHIINIIFNDVKEQSKIVNESESECDDNENNNEIELSSKNIDIDILKNSIINVFPEQLHKHAISEGNKTLVRFHSVNNDELNNNKISYSKMCNLQFSVDYIMANVTDIISKYDTSIDIDSIVYFTAVIEYITAELLQVSGNMCRDMKKARIMAHHLTLAIKNDSELETLFDSVEGISLELSNLMRRTK